MGYNTCEVCGEPTSRGECSNCGSHETYFGSKFGEDFNHFDNTSQFKENNHDH